MRNAKLSFIKPLLFRLKMFFLLVFQVLWQLQVLFQRQYQKPISNATKRITSMSCTTHHGASHSVQPATNRHEEPGTLRSSKSRRTRARLFSRVASCPQGQTLLESRPIGTPPFYQGPFPRTRLQCRILRTCPCKGPIRLDKTPSGSLFPYSHFKARCATSRMLIPFASSNASSIFFGTSGVFVGTRFTTMMEPSNDECTVKSPTGTAFPFRVFNASTNCRKKIKRFQVFLKKKFDLMCPRWTTDSAKEAAAKSHTPTTSVPYAPAPYATASATVIEGNKNFNVSNTPSLIKQPPLERF